MDKLTLPGFVSIVFPTRQTRLLLFLFAICILPSSVTAQNASWVHIVPRSGDFEITDGRRVSDIVISAEDFTVVRIAANSLSSDISQVTGRAPGVRTSRVNISRNAILIGTLDKSPLITSLVKSGKLDIAKLRGKSESFVIATVPNPLPNVSMGLVIVGSDRRGTAFGVFELSQAIGVSPWHWWADVTPLRKSKLFVAVGTHREGPPSVQYRGIFINDEDWGLQPWAAKTFEPELGDIGPKTYARIFELLLRLKANTVWPAMHEVTRAFNLYPGNKRVADDYAIVMGSSHAEPMLRNNVTEWTDKKENFDYTLNPEGVRKYWDKRVAENGKFENIYTLGMRGIHDSAMQGPKSSPERIKVLEQIFADQRNILERHVNPDATAVPQIFCPYKEVLTDYRNGLKVPDDVTIVWPDDNFGYIRTLPTPEEQTRPGGFGVYYHISYLGRPLSYLWLETTPPALIWEEMNKAYEHNVRKFWILNVGDLKPGEIGIEFFMQMAWDISRWRNNNLQAFLGQWAKREFGPEHSDEIASVMSEYYRLNFQRKPEQLQWYLPGEAQRASELSTINYGDEVQQRLDAFANLLNRADRLYSQIPQPLRDAFYELVAYPIRGATFANQRFFLMEKSRLFALQHRASADTLAKQAKAAGDRMVAETRYYNEELAHGKWRNIMSMEPSKGQWPNMRSSSPVPDVLPESKIPTAAGLGVAIEGRVEPVGESESDSTLPTFSVFGDESRFIDIFNTGTTPEPWTARTSNDWIKLSSATGNLRNDSRIQVSIDWARTPKNEQLSGTVKISAAGQDRLVNIRVFNPNISKRGDINGFVETDGVIVIEAEHFKRSVPVDGARWQVISGLGRTNDAVAVFPTTTTVKTPISNPGKSPQLEYPLFLFNSGEIKMTAWLLPTHPGDTKNGLRFAVSLDNEPPQMVAADAGVEVSSRQWSLNVLNSATTATVQLNVAKPGNHILRIRMVDSEVVLDKILLDTGKTPESYLGPIESPFVESGPVKRTTKRTP